MTVKNILMLDLSTRNVKLPDIYNEVLEERLLIQSAVIENRIERKVYRQGLSFSRGFLILAACLEQNGFNTRYVVYSDFQDRKKLFSLIKESDVMCFSAVTLTIDLAARVSRLAKKINPKLITIIGGVHATSLPFETMRDYPEFDILLSGKGEKRIVSLLKNVSHPDNVSGVYYRINKNIINKSASKAEKIALSEIPPPAYHLLSRPLSQYSHNIRTSEGCPYKCNFCIESHSWNSVLESEYTVKQIVNEVDFLATQLPKNTLLHFSDAVFNLRYGRTVELATEIAKLKTGLIFSFDTRVDLIEEKQIALLKNANFLFIRMGFESTNRHILDMSLKSTTWLQQNMASEIIRKTAPNAAVFAYWMTGLPGTTPASLFADIENIQKLIDLNSVDIIGNKVFVPYPKTAQFNNPDYFGLKIHTLNWSRYDRNSPPVFHLNKLSADKIYMGFIEQERALIHAYKTRLGNSAWVNRKTDNHYRDYVLLNYLRNDII